MTKNLKLSFILFFSISAVMIAWRTLASIIGGVGINFVAVLALVTTILTIILTDKFVFSRTKDLFITSCILAGLELLIYFAVEFPVNPSCRTVGGFLIVQNIFSVLAILFFAYTTFRFILEQKEVKLSFIEFLLGNQKRCRKPKKAKELCNGCLEDKPNHAKANEVIDLKEDSNEEELKEDSEEVVEEVEDTEVIETNAENTEIISEEDFFSDLTDDETFDEEE